MQVQLILQLCVFQRRDELGGGEETVLRVDPPGQGLLAADGRGGAADDGLVIGLDVAFTDGLVNVIDNVFFALELFAQGLGIETEIIVVVACRLIAGRPGQVAGHGGGDFVAVDVVDACFYAHLVLFPQVQHGLPETTDPVHDSAGF